MTELTREIAQSLINEEGVCIVPEEYNSIGAGTFYGCTGLTSVTMPIVESIGRSALYEQHKYNEGKYREILSFGISLFLAFLLRRGDRHLNLLLRFCE